MSLLLEAIIYLIAALIAVPISRKLGFGSILGYLAAGIIIGALRGTEPTCGCEDDGSDSGCC